MDNQIPARERILRTVSQLMELQGYHATGLNEIVAMSGAPKGSLYHYFPGGKEEIAIEAIERKTQEGQQRIREVLAQYNDPIEAVRQMILGMAQHMKTMACEGGGNPLVAVAMETANTSENLRRVCENAYESWRKAVEDKFLAGGYSPEKAENYSNLISFAIEGAMIRSRLSRDTKYLESVAETLATLLCTAE